MMVVFDDPIVDLGGTSNAEPIPRYMRHVIANTQCDSVGHHFFIRGYACAHKRYSWMDWRIGRFEQCSRCGGRRFPGLTEDQLSFVLKEERERWEEHFAKEKALVGA